MKKSVRRGLVALGAVLSATALLVFFQNCAQTSFESLPSSDPYGTDGGFGTGGTTGGTDTGNPGGTGGTDPSYDGKPRSVQLEPTITSGKSAKILLVIDNSYTMSQSVQNLSQKIHTLVEQLPGRNLDIGITTVFGSTLSGPVTKYFVRSDGSSAAIDPNNLPALKEISAGQEATYLNQGKYVYRRMDYSPNLNPLAVYKITSTMSASQSNAVARDIENYIANNLQPLKQQVQYEIGLCVISRFLSDDRPEAFIKKGDKVGVVSITDEEDFSVSMMSDVQQGCRTYDHVVSYLQTGNVDYFAQPKIVLFDLPAGDMFLKRVEYLAKPTKINLSYQEKITYDGVWTGETTSVTNPFYSAQDWSSAGAACSQRDKDYIVNTYFNPGSIASVTSCTYDSQSEYELKKYMSYIGLWSEGQNCDSKDLGQLPTGSSGCKYVSVPRTDLERNGVGKILTRESQYMRDWAAGGNCSSTDLATLKATFPNASNCMYSTEASEKIYTADTAAQIAQNLCSEKSTYRINSRDYSYNTVVDYASRSNVKYDKNSCTSQASSAKKSVTQNDYTISATAVKARNFAMGLSELAQTRFANNVFFSSIVNLPSQPCALQQAQSVGTKYIELSTYFGAKAVAKSICGTDYTESLLKIGEFVQQVQNQFVLKLNAKETIKSVVVKYSNGQQLTLNINQFSHLNDVFTVSESVLTNAKTIVVNIGPK